jgi:hypothetical protein
MCPLLQFTFLCHSLIEGLMVLHLLPPSTQCIDHRRMSLALMSLYEYCFDPQPNQYSLRRRHIPYPQFNVTLMHMHNIVVDFYTPCGLLCYFHRRIAISTLSIAHRHPYKSFPYQSTLACLRRGLLHAALTLTISKLFYFSLNLSLLHSTASSFPRVISCCMSHILVHIHVDNCATPRAYVLPSILLDDRRWTTLVSLSTPHGYKFLPNLLIVVCGIVG